MFTATTAIAMFLSGFASQAPYREHLQTGPLDTGLVRKQLAALLPTGDLARRGQIRIEESELPLHPGARLYAGALPGGAHGEESHALVAVTSGGVVLPVGSRGNRLVLQALNPPVIADSTLLSYAAVLAMLEGYLPKNSQVVRDSAAVPSWAKRQAAQRHLELVSAHAENIGTGQRVSVMVLSPDALHLLIVDVGRKRYFDFVRRVVELASKHPG